MLKSLCHAGLTVMLALGGASASFAQFGGPGGFADRPGAPANSGQLLIAPANLISNSASASGNTDSARASGAAIAIASLLNARITDAELAAALVESQLDAAVVAAALADRGVRGELAAQGRGLAAIAGAYVALLPALQQAAAVAALQARGITVAVVVTGGLPTVTSNQQQLQSGTPTSGGGGGGAASP